MKNLNPNDIKDILWYMIGIVAFVFILSIMMNLLINYNGYEYTYLGPWFNDTTQTHTPLEEIQTQCTEICGEYPAMSACPCSHCGCWCVKHEYLGLTREHIRAMCKVF